MSAVRRKVIRAVLALGVVVLGFLPFALEMEQYAAPANAPGSDEGRYVDLPIGRTHYVRAGTGPTLVLVAGLTGNFSVWDQALPILAKHHTVYAMDTLGHGFSERRDEYAYDRLMYREQLRQFIAALKIVDPIVVGTSMGGAIAIDYAAADTSAVRGLVLVDNAGLPFATPAAGKLVHVPLLGEYIISVMMPVIIEQGFERGFYRPVRADRDFRERYAMSARIRGFERAVRESLRQMPLHDLTPELQAIDDAGIRTLIVWGEHDVIVPTSVFGDMQNILPRAESYLVKDAGHMPHAERPEDFANRVVRFARSITPVAGDKPAD